MHVGGLSNQCKPARSLACIVRTYPLPPPCPCRLTLGAGKAVIAASLEPVATLALQRPAKADLGSVPNTAQELVSCYPRVVAMQAALVHRGQRRCTVGSRPPNAPQGGAWSWMCAAAAVASRQQPANLVCRRPSQERSAFYAVSNVAKLSLVMATIAYSQDHKAGQAIMPTLHLSWPQAGTLRQRGVLAARLHDAVVALNHRDVGKC